MIVKSLTADAAGIRPLEDLLFALDRIEFRGYSGVTKQVLNDIPTDVTISLNRRIYAGSIRIKGIAAIPPNQQQQEFNFFISPNDSGARPWEVTVVADKGQQAELIERASFDCQFFLPPATVGLRPNGIIARTIKTRCSVSSGDPQRQAQETQRLMQSQDGKDLVI